MDRDRQSASDEPKSPSRSTGLSRREALKVTAGAVLATQAAALRPAFAEGPGTRFFTPAEFALVDELSEIIIPADEHSPGARAARVAVYIDNELADAFEEAPRTQWREGLRLVNTLATGMHGKPLVDLAPEQRVAVVTRLAEGEPKFTTPEGKFFGELKRRVAYAYYTSKIGIHDEMEYKGNTLLQEFVGTDVSKT
jgi:hypothetical protein